MAHELLLLRMYFLKDRNTQKYQLSREITSHNLILEVRQVTGWGVK